MEKKFLGSTGLAKLIEKLFEVFAKVGHTHSKSEISDFPTIPSNTSQLTNDSGYITADDVSTIIPVDSELSDSSENPVQNKIIHSELKVLSDLIGDSPVIEQITGAISGIDFPVTSVNGKSGDVELEEIYVQPNEPSDPNEGSLWVDTDADPDGVIYLDNTLSFKGMAADAKAVGDALAGKQPVGDYALTSEVSKIISVPSSEESDNGKFLRVVDGEAAWDVVINAEEVSV